MPSTISRRSRLADIAAFDDMMRNRTGNGWSAYGDFPGLLSPDVEKWFFADGRGKARTKMAQMMAQAGIRKKEWAVAVIFGRMVLPIVLGGAVAAIGSGGNYALAAGRALIDTSADAETIARRAMTIAAVALTLRRRKDTKTQDIAEQVRTRREDRVRMVTGMSADASVKKD